METILEFFSNMILFTAGLAVLVMWLCLIVLAIDEGIDLVVNHRNPKSKEDDNE